MELWKRTYELVDVSFLSIFAVEISLRLVGEGARAYFRSPLNVIDSATVASSLVLAVLSSLFDDLSSFGVLRLFRLTRIVKMVGAYNRLVKMRDRWQTRMWQRRVQRSEAASALVWCDDGEPVRLQPPKASSLAAEEGAQRAAEEMGATTTTSAATNAANAAADAFPSYHLFLSHKWAHAQDNAVSIKTALQSLVPSCCTFLDVDDLGDIKDLERCVRHSDVFCVIVTSAYLGSKNCRRELVEALVRQKKPTVLIVECDPEKGATSALQMRAELEVAERDGMLMSFERTAALKLIDMLEQATDGGGDDSAVPTVIEWHREVELRHVAYKALVANVLKQQPAGVRQMQELTEVKIGESSRAAGQSRRAVPWWRPWGGGSEEDDRRTQSSSRLGGGGGGDHSGNHGTSEHGGVHGGGGGVRRLVKMHAGYRQLRVGQTSLSVYEDVASRLRTAGVEVLNAGDEEATDDVPALVLLCPGIFENEATVAMLEELTQTHDRSASPSAQPGSAASAMSAMGRRARRAASSPAGLSSAGTSSSVSPAAAAPIFLYATERSFAFYLNSCPPRLKANGFLNVRAMHAPRSHAMPAPPRR